MANRLNRDGGKAISVGSSTTHDQDLRHDLDNRQTEDMRTRIERRPEAIIEKAKMMTSEKAAGPLPPNSVVSSGPRNLK